MESASLEKNRFKFEIQYGRELRQLRSANEQIAFYVDQQNVGNDGNKQALLDTADEEDPSGYTLALPQHIQTSLDPFVALPGNVTEYERLRVQLCECRRRGFPSSQTYFVQIRKTWAPASSA